MNIEDNLVCEDSFFYDSDEFGRNKEKERLIKKINKSIEEASSALKKLTSAKDNLFSAPDIKSTSFLLGDAFVSIKTCFHLLKDVGYNLSFASNSRSDNTTLLNFEYHNNCLTIVFPSLLPKRVDDSKKTLSHKDIFTEYYPSISEYFSKGKYLAYDKIVLVYTHYFESEFQLIDHDNFETKPFTDMIVSHILPDDNPKYCSQFFRYKIGEYSHSEISIVPWKDFVDFIIL